MRSKKVEVNIKLTGLASWVLPPSTCDVMPRSEANTDLEQMLCFGNPDPRRRCHGREDLGSEILAFRAHWS